MEPEIIFKAMADRTRQRTLSILRRQELSVSELVEVLDQPQSTVSRHLKILRDAGLIRDRRDGNTVMYSIPSLGIDHDRMDLSGRLMDWVDDQPLSASLGSRVEKVLDRRREMSSAFFDRVAQQWDTLREESFGNEFQWEAFLGLLPDDWTVADIGTGTGYLLPTLSRYFHRVIGVDPIDRMLIEAQRRLETDRLDNVDLHRGDLDRLPIHEQAVDLAIAVLVLHHVANPKDAVKELYRIVKKTGRVLIVEQNAHENESFRERMQDRWWGFESDEFCTMLQVAGFQHVRSQPMVNVQLADDAPELFVVTGIKN